MKRPYRMHFYAPLTFPLMYFYIIIVAVMVSFLHTQVLVEEGNVAMLTIVAAPANYDFSFSVLLNYSNGTAMEFYDFIIESEEVSFSPGQANVSFTVVTTEDDTVEFPSTQKFSIEIVEIFGSNSVDIGNEDTAIVAIIDDDEGSIY